MKGLFSRVQDLGRALMLPIAVLPIAGLLLRLGQPDLLDIPAIAAAGDAIFSNLGLLFAIGIAVGLARENHGAAGLAAVVGFLVTMEGAEVLIGDRTAAQALTKLSVPAGILSGIIAGALYNRYSDIRLPDYLAFFGGRRFVPIASGLAGLAMAALFGWGWPMLEQGMDVMSHAVLGAGELGLFAYGVLNRVLIVTGLHHIINNLAWFLIGDYGGVTGDLKRFFAGDPTAGAFMSGFFPVMMFGLPAACLAMYHTARPERRRAVGGLLASMALTSFLTGVTEPIEFTFMFLAPALYVLHALLTGLAMMLMPALGVHLGFSFSAGLFDYIINFGQATHPWRLLPVGLAYAAIYYAVFRFTIVKFRLPTPGRDELAAGAPGLAAGGTRGPAFVRALGGAANLVTVDACTTRLRVIVRQQAAVEVDALRGLGASGVIRPTTDSVQVVVGTIADQVAGEIRAALRTVVAAPAPARALASAAAVDAASVDALLAVLGGAGNVRDVAVASTRLRVVVADAAKVDDAALRAIGRGVARPSGAIVHVLFGPHAAEAAASLRARLAPTG